MEYLLVKLELRMGTDKDAEGEEGMTWTCSMRRLSSTISSLRGMSSLTTAMPS
jgi:hypothetical protein